jgi:hypothetical protein
VGKRTPWAQLKAEYRERLIKKGITPEMHASGVSLRAARGHKDTPEHPGAYNPTQYQSYNQRRKTLLAQLEARKQQLWGGSPRWDAQKSQQWPREKPPSIAELKWAVNDADDDELEDAVRQIRDDETFTFLGYH